MRSPAMHELHRALQLDLMFWTVPLLAAHCSGDSDTGEVLALEAAVWSNWAGMEGLWVQFRSWGLKE